MTIERIVVALDGSKESEGVLGAAHRLLLERPGRITLVQVAAEAGVRADFTSLEAAATRLEQMRGNHEDLVVQYLMREGTDPAGVILDEAPGHLPDILAMTTRGRSGLSRLIAGSTTETVLRNTDIPLLVCNEHGARMSGSETPYKRILVPLDGSDVSDLTLPTVTEIASVYGAEVILLRVEKTELKAGTQRYTQISGYLDHYANALEGNGVTKVELMAATGEPAAAILKTAEDRRVDLVAMGTHGRSGLERLRFGSVTEEVLRRCPCPMILRRPPTD